MKKSSFRLLLAVLSLFLSAHAWSASICENVSKEFSESAHAPASPADIFPLPWQDLIWLKSQLGTADTNNFQQTIAVWKQYNYSLTANNGTVVNVEGQKPQPLNNYNTDTITINDATKELGNPDTFQNSNMTAYTWTCGASGSNLTVVTNNSTGENIVSFKGTYCPEGATPDKCQNYKNDNAVFPQYRNIGYGLQKADLYIQHPSLQPQYTVATAADLGLKQTLQAAKTILQVDVKTFAELQAVATKDVSAYYQKLQKCVPGTYQYPLPFILGGRLITDTQVAPYFYFVTSQIQGMKDGKCAVDSKAVIGTNNGSMTCHYSPATLAMLTPQQALNDADFQTNLTPYQALQIRKLTRECLVYSNGVLLPS